VPGLYYYYYEKYILEIKYPGISTLLASIGNLVQAALNGLNARFFSGMTFKSI
jgi:hypothetical protein